MHPTGKFDRCNLNDLPLEPTCAHGGEGLIHFRRIAEREALDGKLHFIDFAEVPAGVTIGLHHHRKDEEEFYLVLSGQGRMIRDGVELSVKAGDLIRNPPGGQHGLENLGPEPLRLFVFEVEAA